MSTRQTWDAGPQGQVCYYSGPQDALYEKLGHAEVVQIELDGSKAQQEMEKFADVSLHSHYNEDVSLHFQGMKMIPDGLRRP